MSIETMERVGILNLSGEKIIVGYNKTDVFLQANNIEEQIYMSVDEARLLIAALSVAIAYASNSKS